MKKGITKRGIGMIMAGVLVLGTIATGLPAGLFSTQMEAAVSYTPDKAGACIVPYVYGSDGAFMSSHVYNAEFCLNKNFVADSWSGNITPDIKNGDTLGQSKYTKKNHSSLWYTKWKYTPSDVMKRLIDNEQISIGVRADMYSDKHSNISKHSKKRWGKAWLKLVGMSDDTGEGTEVTSKESEDKDDGKAQKISRDPALVKPCDYLSYENGNKTCVCNGSAVGNSVIYAVDYSSPTITNSYISRTKDGGPTDSINGYTYNNETYRTGYLVLEFSESIRFATGSCTDENSNLKAYLRAYSKDDGGYVGNIPAQFVKLSGNRLVFEFKVDEKLSGKLTNVVVNSFTLPGSSSKEAWASTQNKYSVSLLDAKGAVKTFDKYKKQTTSKVTDLAGNGMTWYDGKTMSLASQVYMDNKKVGVEKIDLNVDKVSAPNIPIEETEGDITKNNLFAAAGDKLEFTVTFDDRLNYSVDKEKEFLEKISATLNVKNSSGYVSVKAKSITHPDASEVGTNSNAKGWKSKIVFEKLEVTSDMYQVGGERIKITSLNGLGGVTDICYNALTGIDNITLAPSREQRIDRVAPKASLNVTPVNNVYSPISSQNGKIMTFMINVDDVAESTDTGKQYVSGIEGIRANFKWVYTNNSKSCAYEYCMSKDAIPSAKANWKTLRTATDASSTNKNCLGTFIQYKKGSASSLYLHIRLKDGEDYGTINNSGKVTGTLVVDSMDYAGNKGRDSFSLSHLADETKPSMEQKSSSISGNAERTEATISTVMNVTDDHGVKSVTYQWSGQQPVSCDLTGTKNWKNIDVPISGQFDDTGLDAEKKKTVTLTVTVADCAGNREEKEYSYTLYFDKIENRYSIQAGSASSPVTRPALMMKKPDAISDVAEGSSELFSYVEVEFDSGKRFLYVCDSTEEENIFEQSDWYYIDSKTVSKVGETGEKLVYSLSGTVDGKSAYEKMETLMDESYGTGKMTITVRTADTFEDNSKTSGSLTISYESLDAIAVNRHEDIYIARKGNYRATVKSIVDSNDKDVKNLLAYNPETSEQTAYSLDGVSFVYTLASEKESQYDYNMIDVDTSKSYVKLYKKVPNAENPVCETYPVSNAKEQGFTVASDISETYGSGWYYLEFVIATTDGEVCTTQYYNIYLDRYVYTDFSSDLYNKTYSKTMTYKGEEKNIEYATAKDVDTSMLTAYDTALGVGIAPAPEGYTVKQQLSFDGDPMTPSSDVQNCKMKFRVYNQADIAYESHAVWQDMTGTDSYFSWVYNICETQLDEDGNYVFDASSYKKDEKLYIPLTDGMNVICYEVQSMNGQTTRKFLYLDAKKQTVAEEYDKKQTLTEAQWKLSDMSLASSPRAVMKLHDFYEESVYVYDNTFFARESGSWEFVLYNEYKYGDSQSEYNDNLVADVVSIEAVDGIEPVVENVDYQQDGMNFCYKFSVEDNNPLNLNNLVQLSYDSQYAYKLRRANNTLPENTKPNVDDEVSAIAEFEEEPAIPEYVSLEYDVPFATTDEASGAGVWTEYNSRNYGIYKTQIVWDENKTKAQVSIWGTYMYRDDEEENERCSGEIDLDIMDANGNWTYSGQWYSYENKKPTLAIKGSYDENSANSDMGNLYAYNGETAFDCEGNLMAECDVPLSGIETYGAGVNLAAISENTITDSEYGDEMLVTSPYKYHFLSSVPMIRNAGQFQMEFEDIFGNSYVQDLDTTSGFEEGSDNIKISYSEVVQTNRNVTVMANLVAASGETVESDDRITTIAAVSRNDDGGRVIEKKGEIDLIDNTAARIVMEDNGEVFVEGMYDGHVVQKVIKVNNIDKKIEDVTPVLLYGDGNSEPIFMEGSEDTVDGAVQVILECEEELYGVNGETKYTFPVGSKKGDTYTFEYRDKAGNTGSTTVTLPYNVDKTVPPEPDTTPPEFSGLVSGLRHSYEVLDGIFSGEEDGNAAEVARANEFISSYVSRGYKMAFQVTDESKVKIIAKKAGAQAPTSYSDTSDSIDGLVVNVHTVEITKPAQFDLYFMDTEGNVSSLKGFNLNSFDQTVADVEVQYKVLRNDDDIAFVRAYLVAASEEAVEATNRDATTFMNEEIVSQGGVETKKFVKRYYRDFFENETYQFTYIDVYGNTGKIMAEVKGFDYGAPSQIGIQWFGTRRVTGTDNQSAVMNESPDTEGMTTVNHDITANISYNKAISNVKLYEYDESKENGVGKALTTADAVKAAYVGKKVTVTYENNYDKKIVVSSQAQNSGKRAYTVLPAVKCIDKKAPGITVNTGELSADKQVMTYTITTDEETYFNNGTKSALQHTYTAKSNGDHEISVMDQSGNISTYTIHVEEIDDKVLELSFGVKPDGSDLTTDIESLDLKTSEILYVKSTKDAQVVLGDKAISLKSGETGSLQLGADAGVNLLHAVDTSTGKEYIYKVMMRFKDMSAPIISFESGMLSFLAGTDRETIEEAVKSGIIVQDNKDGIIDSSKVSISGIPMVWKTGIHVITYTVSDSEGNESSATRSVYLYEKGTPNIQINGEDCMPYGTMIVNSPTIRVKGTNLSQGTLLVKYRSGIKTAAQMKYGKTGVMLDGKSSGKEQSFTLPERSGFYTVYIRTQNRKEQITYVYVDLSE